MIFHIFAFIAANLVTLHLQPSSYILPSPNCEVRLELIMPRFVAIKFQASHGYYGLELLSLQILISCITQTVASYFGDRRKFSMKRYWLGIRNYLLQEWYSDAAKSVNVDQGRTWQYNLPIAKILSVKIAWACVSMVLYLKK